MPAPDIIERVRKALTVGFANRIARRMRLHNGYRTCNEKGALAQIHPGSSQLACDDDGLLPEWLIYHEFVATSRPFLRQVSKHLVMPSVFTAVLISHTASKRLLPVTTA
eukprot:GHRR01027181.1.p2 GENE.GHRR01027181.1~~GHRR01027181.1.p2  ORF type:complete len:109 (-),score=28.11 GHRR01027181.1:657-983(-)